MAPKSELGGGKDDWEEVKDDWQDVPVNQFATPQDTLELNAGNFFGTGPKLTAAAQTALDVAHEGKLPESFKDLYSRYLRNRKEADEAYSKADAENPKSALAGSAINAGVSSAIPGMAGAKLAQGANASQKAVAGAKMGAKLGALYGLGSSDIDKGDVSGTIKNVAKDTVAGGLAGAVPAKAALGLAGGAYLSKDDLAEGNYGKAALKTAGSVGAAYALPALARGAQKYANPKSLLSNLSGVKEEAIQDYLDRHAALKGQDAQALKGEMKQSLDTTTSRLGDAVDKAEQNLTTQRQAGAAQAGEQLENSMGDLKDLTGLASSEARGTIKNGGPGVDKADLVNYLKTERQKLLPFGHEVGATPGAGQAGVQELSNWIDFAEKLPDEIPPEQAKNLIQRLDEASDRYYSAGKGEFPPEVQAALARTRQAIDEHLKLSIPAYKDAMVPTAGYASTLSKARDEFGSGSVATLQNIANPKNAKARELIAQMEDMTGRKILEHVDPSKMPETAALKTAQDAYNPVSSISPRVSGSSGAENFINRMAEGKAQNVTPKIDDQNLMTALSQHNPELPEKIKDFSTLNAFTGQRTNGSRNAVRFGAAGTAIGYKLGGPQMAAAGGAFGGGLGTLVDVKGPQMARDILDAYKARQPGFEKISQPVIKMARAMVHPVYSRILQQAQSRGGQDSAAATFFLLSQSDPEFRKIVEDDPHNPSNR